MPLFMDFHKVEGITLEELKTAHLKDVAVQDKFGVKYHQFWVNLEAGLVFCLMEGPSKESCECVHREAHGIGACAVVEVEPGFYELFMGKGHVIDNGHVLHPDGSPDLGVRSVMVVNIIGVTSAKNSRDNRFMILPLEARNLVAKRATEFHGRVIESLGDYSIIRVFHSASNALLCAREIQAALMEQNKTAGNSLKVSFRIGISAGQPVTESDSFFGEAIKLAYRLSLIARENQILLSSLAKDSSATAFTSIARGKSKLLIKATNSGEEEFITSLFQKAEVSLSDEYFTVATLSRDIGVSRPQLYRKVTSITGRSPNDLLRDLRLEKARGLLRRNSGNVSEVALAVGYTNPSYFAKCFTQKFGCTPSKFAELAIAPEV